MSTIGNGENLVEGSEKAKGESLGVGGKGGLLGSGTTSQDGVPWRKKQNNGRLGNPGGHGRPYPPLGSTYYTQESKKKGGLWGQKGVVCRQKGQHGLQKKGTNLPQGGWGTSWGHTVVIGVGESLFVSVRRRRDKELCKNQQGKKGVSIPGGKKEENSLGSSFPHTGIVRLRDTKKKKTCEL